MLAATVSVGCINKGDTVFNPDNAARDDDETDAGGSNDEDSPRPNPPAADDDLTQDDSTDDADDDIAGDDATEDDTADDDTADDDAPPSGNDDATAEDDDRPAADDDVVDMADAGEPSLPANVPEGVQLTSSFSDKPHFDVAYGSDRYFVTWVTALEIEFLLVDQEGSSSEVVPLDLGGMVAPSEFSPEPRLGNLRAAVAYSETHLVGPAFAVAWLHGDAEETDLYFQWLDVTGTPDGDPLPVLSYIPPEAGYEASGTLEMEWSEGIYGIDFDQRNVSLVTVTEQGVGTLHPQGNGVLYDFPLRSAGDGSFLKLVEWTFTHTSGAPQGPMLYRFDDGGLLPAGSTGVQVTASSNPDELYPIYPVHAESSYAMPPFSTTVWDGDALSIFSDSSGNDEISGLMYHRLQVGGSVSDPKELEPTDYKPLDAVYNQHENELAVLATSLANRTLFVGRYRPGGNAIEPMCAVTNPDGIASGKLIYDGTGYRAFYSALAEDGATQIFTITAECAAR